LRVVLRDRQLDGDRVDDPQRLSDVPWPFVVRPTQRFRQLAD